MSSYSPSALSVLCRSSADGPMDLTFIGDSPRARTISTTERARLPEDYICEYENGCWINMLSQRTQKKPANTVKDFLEDWFDGETEIPIDFSGTVVLSLGDDLSVSLKELVPKKTTETEKKNDATAHAAAAGSPSFFDGEPLPLSAYPGVCAEPKEEDEDKLGFTVTGAYAKHRRMLDGLLADAKDECQKTGERFCYVWSRVYQKAFQVAPTTDTTSSSSASSSSSSSGSSSASSSSASSAAGSATNPPYSLVHVIYGGGDKCIQFLVPDSALSTENRDLLETVNLVRTSADINRAHDLVLAWVAKNYNIQSWDSSYNIRSPVIAPMSHFYSVGLPPSLLTTKPFSFMSTATQMAQ